MAGHMMNPFDFVPWYVNDKDEEQAQTWQLAQLGGDPQSGAITLRLRALTPLHVAGCIDGRPDAAMTKRYFYGQRGGPCVPGSSLKGMLRAYIEALTNGWFSGVQATYEQKTRELAEAFHLGEGEDSVLPAGYLVPGEHQGIDEPMLDAASHLFGITPRRGENDTDAKGKGAQQLSRRARVVFEDVFFDEASLGWSDSLDLNDKAAFGGPKPRRNSFWYFTAGPFEIVARSGRPIFSPVGGHLRGRKLYFHQDPVRRDGAVDWYLKHWQRLVRVPTECVQVGAVSRPFTLHFRDVPAALLRLLLFALCPPGRVRHKLGALKPLGFGSVELMIDKLSLEAKGLDLLDIDPAPQDGSALLAAAQDPAALIGRGLVHKEAWVWIQHILHCPEQMGAHRLFVYPPYRQAPGLDAIEKGFAQVLQPRSLPDKVQRRLRNWDVSWSQTGTLVDDRETVLDVIRVLYEDQQRGKQPLHLPTYQQGADNYEQVCQDGGPMASEMRRLRSAHS